jgi:GAF domain-containing protein
MQVERPYIKILVASDSPGNPYRPGDQEKLDNSGLYCETVVRTKKKLLVPNALADEAWKDNPDVKLSMISYLGFPILWPDGSAFGTICVLDSKENRYSPDTEQLMTNFKELIESHIEVITMNQVLGDRNARLTDYLAEIQAFRGMVSICSCCKSIRDEKDNWKPIEELLITHPDAEFTHGLCPSCVQKFWSDTGSS